jgi:mannose-6-phosphate isomerase-like protein (cupin superfamily)
MQVRLVATGHNAQGRSVFVHDQQVDAMPIPGLGELTMLWSADEPATYPNAGDNPRAPGIFPALGGVRFVMATYSPEYVVSAPENVARRHVEEGDEPGFHRTDTTDFGVLISGNLAVELDDGAEVVLNPGDVFIENGTRHRWRVVGDKPATMASLLVGANPRS